MRDRFVFSAEPLEHTGVYPIRRTRKPGGVAKWVEHWRTRRIGPGGCDDPSEDERVGGRKRASGCRCDGHHERRRDARGRRCHRAGPGVPGGWRGDGPSGSSGAKTKLTPQEARELTQALRQLQAAVQADREAGSRTVEVKVQAARADGHAADPDLGRARPTGRPLPDQEQPQGRAGHHHDRRRVRPPDLLRPDRQAAHARAVRVVRARPLAGQARPADRHPAQQPGIRPQLGQYWRDVIMFHATNENPTRVRFDELEDWLAKQLQANKPWDEIVTEMITATGRNDENGAVAFPLAHEAQPVEMAGEVSRIFMGVQIQCAQCHDHKTDSWKRRQFHEFAAFFAGAQAAAGRARPPRASSPSFAVESSRGRAATRCPTRTTPPSRSRSPRGSSSSSSKSKQPSRLFPRPWPSPSGAALAASYVTGQDNPWFAKAFINRIWYALMGEAFYEPIDDIGPERTPKAPEVLEPLADQWQTGGYDIRWLFRTILNTQAYQRRVRSTANAAGKTPFASSCPSRLRADQVFDALAQALGLPLDADGNLVRQARTTSPRRARARTAPVEPGRSQGGRGHSQGGRPRRPPRPPGCPPAGKKAGAAVAPGRTAARVRPPLRRRSLGPQRRRPGHDPPGPVLDEQPAGQQPDRRPAGHRAGRDPRHRARRAMPPWTRSTCACCPASPPPKEVEICGRYLASRRQPPRGIRRHLLEPDQLDRVPHPALRSIAAVESRPPRSTQRPARSRTQQRGQEPWTLENEMVQVAMNGEGVIGRRHFLQTIGLGAAGLAAIGGHPHELHRLDGPPRRRAAQAADGLHPALDGRRPQPARDVRPQAGHRARRRDQGDRDGRPRHLDRRGLGPDGQGHEGHRPGPLDDQQGGQPSAGDLPAPHRLRTVGDGQAPEHRLLDGQRAGRKPSSTCRTSSASAGRPSARASWARPSSRSSSRTPSKPPENTAAQGRRPTASAAGSACSTGSRAPGFERTGGADRVRDHTRPLPPDRQDDPLAPHAGLRPRTRSPSRSATPTAGPRSARAACWPAGWSRPASPSSRSAPTAGTPTSRTTRRSASSPPRSTRASPP